MTDESFGEWLKRARRAKGLTQEQLAMQVNCSISTLRKIESEERRASIQMVDLFAEVFNISPEEKTTFLKFARGDLLFTSGQFAGDIPTPVSSFHRSNLPSPSTSLIGREKELADVCEYLLKVDIRLVTLIGPPGIGKTRLSIESAHETSSAYADGVFFVPLAPLDNSSLVAPSIIQSLGYVETKKNTAIEQVIDDIGEKQLLLVLDNFEHLIDGTASLVSDLLSACPRLKILVTSREALRIPGEWIYSVPSLEIPQNSPSMDVDAASTFSAVTLFVERARAVRSDFSLNAGNIQDILYICEQLDGLPLAIELIAARMRVMSPHALRERLSDQFVLSADGMRAVPARQKTLHNAIGWSYNLLSPEDQRLFAHLSVFAGGCTLEIVEAIFSETFTSKSMPDLIASLLDKSLIQRIPDERGGIRYDMLVTIQQYALNCLRSMGDESAARDAHLTYFLDFAERAEKELHGADQVEWTDHLESERDNFHAALEWCVTNQKAEAALRLLSALCWSWDVRSHYSEMHNWFDRIRALPLVNDHPAMYAKVLNHAAQHKWMLGDFRDAQALLEESRIIWLKLGVNGEQGLAKTLDWLGMVARWSMGDNNTAQPLFEQGFNLYQRHGDRSGMAESMFHLAIVEFDRNNIDSALSLFEKSMDLFRGLGDHWGVARVSQLLGQLFLSQGNYEQARFFFEQHLTIDEKLNFTEGIQVALRNFGNLYRYQGDYIQAEQFYEKSLLVCREYGLKDDISNILFSLGLLALHRNDYSQAAQFFTNFYDLARTVYGRISACDLCMGLAAVAAGTNQPERAAKLFGAAQEFLGTAENRFSPFDRTEFDRHIQIARNQLGKDTFDSFAMEGRELEFDHLVSFAIGV